MLPLVKPTELLKYTENDVKDGLELRLWASYRGQTLARTGEEQPDYANLLCYSDVVS